MKKKIYLDYAAATPLDDRIRRVMEPYFSEEFGNPSSIHEKGRKAREAVEQARKTIARILGCKANEIVFTSGATEADALAILGVAYSFVLPPTTNHQPPTLRGHLMTTRIEHATILQTFRALEREGFKTTYLDVSSDGLVDSTDVAEVLRPDTLLVSIGYANSEIGTIQPVAEIAKCVNKFRENLEFGTWNLDKKISQSPSSNSQSRKKTPFFHTDASQAAGFLDLNVQRLGVDLMTLNSAKIYGPKGVGCLYVRHGIRLEPIIRGGGQESGLRSGSENVPGIVGFAKAFEIAEEERKKESARLSELRGYFITALLKTVPGAALNGHPSARLPNNVNISILGVEGEALVLYMSQNGVYASTGSACSSASLEPSHVIKALGKSEEYTRGSLRFTLGRSTKKKDIDYVLKALKDVIRVLKGVKAQLGRPS